MGSTGHFDNQIQPAHVFLRSIKKSEIEKFSHQMTKKIIIGIIRADSCVQSGVIGFFLERDLMSTFVQMPHIPRYLQQQIHQTLQLTHTPPSVPSLQLYLYLSEKHRGKQKQVLMKTNCLDQQQLLSYPPLELHFFPTQVLLSNSMILQTGGRRQGGLRSTATIKLVLQERARLPWRTKSPWTTRGAAHVVEVRAGLHGAVHAHFILAPCSRVPTGRGYAPVVLGVTTGCPCTSCMGLCPRRWCTERLPKHLKRWGAQDKMGNVQKKQDLWIPVKLHSGTNKTASTVSQP